MYTELKGYTYIRASVGLFLIGMLGFYFLGIVLSRWGTAILFSGTVFAIAFYLAKIVPDRLSVGKTPFPTFRSRNKESETAVIHHSGNKIHGPIGVMSIFSLNRVTQIEDSINAIINRIPMKRDGGNAWIVDLPSGQTELAELMQVEPENIDTISKEMLLRIFSGDYQFRTTKGPRNHEQIMILSRQRNQGTNPPPNGETLSFRELMSKLTRRE